MIKQTVGELLEVLRHEEFIGTPAARRRVVRGYSTDSRSLKKGEVFVALKGERFDGHRFIKDAAERGAAAAVVSRRWARRPENREFAVPLVVVADTLRAYGAIAAAHRSSFNYPVIAVAGSNGKTTTKELIAEVLGTRYNVLRTEGNLNNLIGVPATMLRMTDEHTAAVVEIGTNQVGEIARLCEILAPTHGLITNIGPEHLEGLGSVEGVAQEEGALFGYLAANGGTAIVNMDDRHLARMAKALPGKVLYGTTAKAEIRGKITKSRNGIGPALEVTYKRGSSEKSFAVNLRTPGRHTAVNALAAAAVGLTLKTPVRGITGVLEAFEPIVYAGGYARLAVAEAWNGARILNDTYNANPGSVQTALATLREMKPGRKGRRVAVLADMNELGGASDAEHEKVGRAIASGRKVDAVLFFGERMRGAYRAIAEGDDPASIPAFHFRRKDRLSTVLMELLTPADVVLVKGSRSFGMEEIVKRLVEGPGN